jgi:hypothetical protein
MEGNSFDQSFGIIGCPPDGLIQYSSAVNFKLNPPVSSRASIAFQVHVNFVGGTFLD